MGCQVLHKHLKIVFLLFILNPCHRFFFLFENVHLFRGQLGFSATSKQERQVFWIYRTLRLHPQHSCSNRATVFGCFGSCIDRDLLLHVQSWFKFRELGSAWQLLSLRVLLHFSRLLGVHSWKWRRLWGGRHILCLLHIVVIAVSRCFALIRFSFSRRMELILLLFWLFYYLLLILNRRYNNLLRLFKCSRCFDARLCSEFFWSVGKVLRWCLELLLDVWRTLNAASDVRYICLLELSGWKLLSCWDLTLWCEASCFSLRKLHIVVFLKRVDFYSFSVNILNSELEGLILVADLVMRRDICRRYELLLNLALWIASQFFVLFCGWLVNLLLNRLGRHAFVLINIDCHMLTFFDLRGHVHVAWRRQDWWMVNFTSFDRCSSYLLLYNLSSRSKRYLCDSKTDEDLRMVWVIVFQLAVKFIVFRVIEERHPLSVLVVFNDCII